MDQKISRVVVDQGRYGEIIRAATPFSKGETIFYLSGGIVPAPTKYTIQLGQNQHVLTLDSIWKCMNHACEPNVRIDVDRREMVAARDISAGEEMNFNYNTTEWSMTSPFPCGCRAPTCAGEIRGFRYLTQSQRQAIKPYLSPFIQKRWAEDVSGAGASAAPSVRSLKPEVNILIPYTTEKGRIVSSEYDNAPFRAELKEWFDPLGLAYVWRSVTVETVEDVVEDLVKRSKETAIVVLNLCDGLDEAGSPGLSMVQALTKAGLPFTGADAAFYDVTSSKIATKKLLRASGVNTGAWVVIEDIERDTRRAADEIGYPLFVKPDRSAGSFGIGANSVCNDLEAARAKAKLLRAERYFDTSDIFAEPFIDGREFTVLVVEDATQPLGLYVLPAGERVFDQRVPTSERFLIYERYWGLPEESRPIPEGEPYYWYALAPTEFQDEIANIARRAIRGVDGSGYARVDLRRSERDGKFYVLEVNAQCGLSCDDSATCGSLLKLSGHKISEVVEKILDHALARNA